METLRAALTAPAAPGKIRVAAVYGPTACGKTALSVEIARALGGECVNADSRQAYRGLDVGTGKVTAAEAAGIPHRLLDFKDPGETVTVGEFVKLAGAAIRDVAARGKLPVLVGGTGLYLDAVLRGFDIPSAEPDWDFRADLEAFAAEKGNAALWERLRERDPDYAAELDPNNARYVIRALEVLEKTGRSKREAGIFPESPFDAVMLTPFDHDSPEARKALYAKIDARTAAMFENGLLEEAKAAAEKWGADAPGLRAIGYPEALAILNGTLSRADAVALAQKRARNYAKRQTTWFRRYPERYPGKCLENVRWA